MVAVQVAEHRLEANHTLAIQRHVHAKHAVGRWMVRPHGHFKQLAFPVRLNMRWAIPAFVLVFLLYKA